MERALNVMVVGAGNRGESWTGSCAESADVPVNVVSVVEPKEAVRNSFADRHGVSEEYRFGNSEDAFRNKIDGLDAVFITSPDKFHYESAIMALGNGCNVLLEKPMATSPQECVDIVNAQERSGGVLSIGHVLRYAPFFGTIKEILDSGELGAVKSLDLREDVADWHFVHSYVRGPWNNSEESSPIILAKSCHDLDIIRWLVPGNIEYVASEAGGVPFKSGAPEGALERCTDGCDVKDCRYNSRGTYLVEKDSAKVGWYEGAPFPTDKSIKGRRKAIEEGPFGKCVWDCDNDQPSWQDVRIDYKGGVRANFHLRSGGDVMTRDIMIELEKGRLVGDLYSGELVKMTYGVGRYGAEKETINLTSGGGHGGGDPRLLRAFYDSVVSGDSSKNLTDSRQSLDSHLMAFAAEESRHSGKSVDFEDYKKKYSVK